MSHREWFWLPLLLLVGITNPRLRSERYPAVINHQRMGTPGVFLKYDGTITGQGSIMLELRFEIDSTIGLRYDCEMFRSGSTSFSHIVIYYRFDNPNQCILYNYVTRKQKVLSGGSNSSGAGVSTVGMETVNGYNCMHLLEVNNNKETSHYWMSNDLPGYRTLMNVLPTINAQYAMMNISTTIFNWGGLVKAVGNDPDAKFNLDITEALADTSFLPSDFQVPTAN